MRPRRKILMLLLSGMLVAWNAPLRAGTIVISNRTANKVAFQFTENDGAAENLSLASGELCSLPCKRGGKITYVFAEGAKDLPLNNNSVYCFIEPTGKIEFREVGLSAKATPKPAIATPAISTLPNLDTLPSGLPKISASKPEADDDPFPHFVGPSQPPANTSPQPNSTANPAPKPTSSTTPNPNDPFSPTFNTGSPKTTGATTPSAPNNTTATVPGQSPKVDPDLYKKVLTIPIKVLVNDDEQATAHAWKGRLSRRIQAANDIFEKQCRVRFEIVAYDQWTSDHSITDFNKSLAEFEHKVKPDGARIAIGFTSQYEVPTGYFHLGGTRGPMYSHILVREWSKHINEPERLEVLIHELGHFMGAVHSAALDSTMRSILGDRQARVKDFRIGFDPVNVLAMSLISEDMRSREIHSFAELSPEVQYRLNDIYASMAVSLPKDSTADEYRQKLPLPKANPPK